MGVTFAAISHPGTPLVPFHWSGMCDAHHAVDMPDRGGAGPKQSILLNVAALRASVCQMESTSHDLFATLAAFGCGRSGSTRHKRRRNRAMAPLAEPPPSQNWRDISLLRASSSWKVTPPSLRTSE